MSLNTFGHWASLPWNSKIEAMFLSFSNVGFSSIEVLFVLFKFVRAKGFVVFWTLSCSF